MIWKDHPDDSLLSIWDVEECHTDSLEEYFTFTDSLNLQSLNHWNDPSVPSLKSKMTQIKIIYDYNVCMMQKDVIIVSLWIV